MNYGWEAKLLFRIFSWVQTSMCFRALCLFALVALVGACETSSEDGASSSTSGAEGSGSGFGSEAGGGSGMSGSDSVSRDSVSPVKEALVDVGDRVYFGYDQYDLSAEARATLEQQAALLRKHPATDIVIQGHCDERGTREYNLALGERRASSAKDYLVALGISPARIQTVSFGEERPAAIGSNESALAQNRRAVTVVAGGAASS